MAGLLKIGSAHLRTESSESSGIYISARNLSLEARRQMSCNRGIMRAAQSSSFFVLVQGRADELYKYLLLQLDCIASFDNSELRRKPFSSRHILCQCHRHPKCWLPLPFGHGCGGLPSAAGFRLPGTAGLHSPEVQGAMFRALEPATVSWVCQV